MQYNHRSLVQCGCPQNTRGEVGLSNRARDPGPRYPWQGAEGFGAKLRHMTQMSTERSHVQEPGPPQAP